MSDPTLQSELNRCDPNSLADRLRDAGVGDVLAALAGLAPITETVAMTSNAGTLAHPALSILGIQAAAGSVTGVLSALPSTATLITKTAKLGLDQRSLSTFGTDAVTSVVVTYIPMPATLIALAANLAASP